MKSVAQGDHEALRSVVRRHQEAVFRLAYRYLGTRAEAEDMAQETFVRLFEAAPRYQPTAGFRSYLFTIVTRLCLNKKARFSNSRELPTDASVLEELPSGAATSPEHDLISQERRSAVRAAILALPDEQRMAIVLFRFQGLSYAEIAEAMSKTVPAVTSLIWRANERLRDGLHHLLPDEKSKVRKDSPSHRLDRTEAKIP